MQMPDVWINLAHVYFAQGNFSLAVKMVSDSAQSMFSTFCIFCSLFQWKLYAYYP